MIETSITSMNWVAQSSPSAIQRRGSGLEEDMVPFNGVSAERISSHCAATHMPKTPRYQHVPILGLSIDRRGHGAGRFTSDPAIGSRGRNSMLQMAQNA